jgi:guanosine-3',5'-bis(diphosphate) 3'-pyrophosphohydrolase
VRKDGKTPYFAHPVRVMMTVREVFGCGDEAALCAAVLHDTIEDTTTDYDDLHERFGGQVADLVAALTKNMALPEERREPGYDKQLAAADWRARLVKCADAFDNLCDVETLDVSKRAERRRDAAEKARRAIALVVQDAKSHEPIRVAITALRARLAT